MIVKQLNRQGMFDTAVSFFLAGERCREAIAFNNYELHALNNPTFVNFALSMEICLKILDPNFDPTKKTIPHGVRELIERLPDETQADLTYLSKNIKIIDNVFVDWRYDYEKEILGIIPEIQRTSAIICLSVVKKNYPGLKSWYERNGGDLQPQVRSSPREWRLVPYSMEAP